MAIPAIYIDECVDHRLASNVRAIGVDVETVADASNLSNDDASQLLYATNQNRVLLSQNQVDFRRLHATFRQARRPHGGIILVPQTLPYTRFEHRVRLVLDWVGTFSDHRSRLFTWTELQQLIIHGFRMETWKEQVVRDAVGWRS